MYQLRTKLGSKSKNKNSKLSKNAQQQQQQFQQQQQSLQLLQQSTEEKQKRFRIGAVGDRAKKDIKREPEHQQSTTNESDGNAAGNGVTKAFRRLYFPPLKSAKAVDSILSNLTNSSNTSRNDVQVYNDHGFRSGGGGGGGGVLNKHGIAKTCIRPPSISTAQQLDRKSPTPPPPPPTPLQPSSSVIGQMTTHQPVSHHKSIDFTDYFNVNSKLRIGYSPSTESRTKIRDNIRRNRSFKTINSNNNSNDLIIEESNSFNQNRPFSSVIGQLYANKSVKQFHKPTTSASVHDLIEKFSSSKLLNSVGNHESSSDSLLSCGTNTKNNNNQSIGSSTKLLINNNEKLVSATKTMKNIVPKLTNPFYENKLFIERQKSPFSMGVGGGGGRSDNRPRTGEIKLDSSAGTSIDHSFRLYKMSSEGLFLFFLFFSFLCD